MGIHFPQTVENINKTILCIEQSDDFDMRDWDTCLKAHAIEAMGRGSIDPQLVPYERVARFLGLPESKAITLFVDGVDLTRDEVVAVLRHFRDTGRLEHLGSTGAVESLPMMGSADRNQAVVPCDNIPF